MKSVRLLPIVVMATSALLVFKTVGLLTHGGYVLTGTLPVAAQTAPAGGGAGAAAKDQASVSPAEAAAATKAADALFANTGQGGASGGKQDAVPVTTKKNGETVKLTGNDGSPLSNDQILERLRQRRDQLDKRAADLDSREAIVAAAEKKLQQRADALKALEQKVNALVAERKAMDDKQFAGLIAMYEAMRPADAANIFDKLSMDVLLKVARSMNPRKLAPVVAKMDPSVAEGLTVKLANVANDQTVSSDSGASKSLPQIVGQ